MAQDTQTNTGSTTGASSAESAVLTDGLGANIKKARDSEHDAFYNTETLEWIDSVCSDESCEFCKDRPPKFEPPNG